MTISLLGNIKLISVEYIKIVTVTFLTGRRSDNSYYHYTGMLVSPVLLKLGEDIRRGRAGFGH
jgi:hypothetical protein